AIISTKSVPDTEKNGTPASPAVASANSVFPVPGGPDNRAPLGILAPNFSYRLGSLKNSTNSIISTFASANPATSLNRLLDRTSFNFNLRGSMMELNMLLAPLREVPRNMNDVDAINPTKINTGMLGKNA